MMVCIRNLTEERESNKVNCLNCVNRLSKRVQMHAKQFIQVKRDGDAVFPGWRREKERKKQSYLQIIMTRH